MQSEAFSSLPSPPGRAAPPRTCPGVSGRWHGRRWVGSPQTLTAMPDPRPAFPSWDWSDWRPVGPHFLPTLSLPFSFLFGNCPLKIKMHFPRTASQHNHLSLLPSSGRPAHSLAGASRGQGPCDQKLTGWVMGWLRKRGVSNDFLSALDCPHGEI